jgi:hypothetical protein
LLHGLEKTLSMNRTAIHVSRFVLMMLCIGCVFIWPVPPAYSQDPATVTDIPEETGEDEIDDLLEGFGDDETAPPVTAAPEPPSLENEKSYHLSGELSLSAAYNFAHDAPAPGQTDWRGLSRLRSLLAVEFEAEPSDVLEIKASGYAFYDLFYALRGANEFTPQVLDTYQQDFQLLDTYVLYNPVSSVDFRFGRQTLVWGKSDNIRITDVLNPLDLREPGLTDLEYIRLPVTVSKLDYYLGNWRFSGAAIHEIRFDISPVFGSDYFPFPAPLPPQDIPSNGGSNTEWAFSAGSSFTGWDIEFYLADHFNDVAHLEPAPPGSGSMFVRRYARLQMVGGTANYAYGNWLFKTEAAWQDGLKYVTAPGKTFSRFDVLFGVEYSGIRETTISVEAANRHTNDFDDRLRLGPIFSQSDVFQSAVRVTSQFLNDTLTCTLLAMAYGPLGQDGAFQRLQAEYDIRDNLELTGGVVLYQSGDLPEFQAIGDNDRFFLELSRHF